MLFYVAFVRRAGARRREAPDLGAGNFLVVEKPNLPTRAA